MGFDRQKNSAKHPNRRGVVEKAWATLMQKQVLSQVHRYAEPSVCDDPVVAKPVQSETFRAPVLDCAAEFKGVSTFKQETDYYSPGGASYCQVYADLGLVEFVQQFSLHHCVQDLWLAELAQAKHHILIRHLYGEEPSPWYFVLRPNPGSCAAVWPAQECVGPSGVRYFRPQPSQVLISQTLLPILDLSRWDAVSFEWKAPLTQHLQDPKASAEQWGGSWAPSHRCWTLVADKASSTSRPPFSQNSASTSASNYPKARTSTTSWSP